MGKTNPLAERDLLIRGKRWTIGFSSKMKFKGTCDYCNKKIMLKKRKNHRDRLNTMIHEILHASLPDLKEEAVDETAEAIEKGLKVAGESGFFYQ